MTVAKDVRYRVQQSDLIFDQPAPRHVRKRFEPQGVSWRKKLYARQEMRKRDYCTVVSANIRLVQLKKIFELLPHCARPAAQVKIRPSVQLFIRFFDIECRIVPGKERNDPYPANLRRLPMNIQVFAQCLNLEKLFYRVPFTASDPEFMISRRKKNGLELLTKLAERPLDYFELIRDITSNDKSVILVVGSGDLLDESPVLGEIRVQI